MKRTVITMLIAALLLSAAICSSQGTMRVETDYDAYFIGVDKKINVTITAIPKNTEKLRIQLLKEKGEKASEKMINVTSINTSTSLPLPDKPGKYTINVTALKGKTVLAIASKEVEVYRAPKARLDKKEYYVGRNESITITVTRIPASANITVEVPGTNITRKVEAKGESEEVRIPVKELGIGSYSFEVYLEKKGRTIHVATLKAEILRIIDVEIRWTSTETALVSGDKAYVWKGFEQAQLKVEISRLKGGETIIIRVGNRERMINASKPAEIIIVNLTSSRTEVEVVVVRKGIGKKWSKITVKPFKVTLSQVGGNLAVEFEEIDASNAVLVVNGEEHTCCRAPIPPNGNLTVQVKLGVTTLYVGERTRVEPRVDVRVEPKPARPGDNLTINVKTSAKQTTFTAKYGEKEVSAKISGGRGKAELPGYECGPITITINPTLTTIKKTVEIEPKCFREKLEGKGFTTYTPENTPRREEGYYVYMGEAILEPKEGYKCYVWISGGRGKPETLTGRKYLSGAFIFNCSTSALELEPFKIVVQGLGVGEPVAVYMSVPALKNFKYTLYEGKYEGKAIPVQAPSGARLTVRSGEKEAMLTAEPGEAGAANLMKPGEAGGAGSLFLLILLAIVVLVGGVGGWLALLRVRERVVVTVSVVDVEGRPRSRVVVEVLRNGKIVETKITGVEGKAKFMLRKGTYKFRAKADTLTAEVEQEVKAPGEVVLRLEKPRRRVVVFARDLRSRPIKGAVVKVLRERHTLYSKTTDQDGRVVVELEAGEYELVASHPDYGEAKENIAVEEEGQQVVLTLRKEREVVTEVVAPLTPLPKTCQVRVLVRDERGMPVNLAEVEVYRDEQRVERMFTNSEGVAVFELKPGSYKFIVSKLGYKEVEKYRIIREDTSIYITLPSALPALYLLRVTVLDDRGEPVRGAHVAAYRGGREEGKGYTNSKGTITLRLPPGSYELIAQATGYQETSTTVIVPRDKETTIVIRRKTYKVEVKVVGRELKGVLKPLAEVKVTARDTLSGRVVAEGYTNASGLLDLELPPGTYVFKASKAGYRDAMKTTIVRRGGLIELVLKPEIYRVTFKVLCRGKPVPGARVVIYRDDEQVNEITTNPRGLAQLTLPAGEYKAVASAKGFLEVKKVFIIAGESLVELNIEPSEYEVLVSVLNANEAKIRVKGDGIEEESKYEAGKVVIFKLPKGKYTFEASYTFKVDPELILSGEKDCIISELRTRVDLEMKMRIPLDAISYLKQVSTVPHLRYWYKALEDVIGESKRNRYIEDVLSIFVYFLKKWSEKAPLSRKQSYSWEARKEIASKVLEGYRSTKYLECNIEQIRMNADGVRLLMADELAPISLRILRSTIRAVEEYIKVIKVSDEDKAAICRFLALLYDLAAAQINKPRFIPVYYV